VCPDSGKDTITEEVALRLDDLFSDDEGTADELILKEEVENKAEASADNPLRELKSIILSIDWEITDDNMVRFVEQVESLKSFYKDDRINLMFLQLLGSLGEYIKTNKGASHPNSFKVLSSVYKQLEAIVGSQNLDDAKKKKYLFVELNKYKELKEEIALGKSEKKKKQKPISMQHAEPEIREKSDAHILEKTRDDAGDGEGYKKKISNHHADQLITAMQFEGAINELKQFIMDQFQKIREEIRLGRKV